MLPISVVTFTKNAQATIADAIESVISQNFSNYELIAIDGHYRTAEDMDASLRSRPAQCWLEDNILSIAVLD